MASGIGGGRGTFRLTPMRPDGTTRQWDKFNVEDIQGCHAGDYAGLNIYNPVPGYLYQWIRNTGTSMTRERGKGGVPVTSDDPDKPAFAVALSDDESDYPTSLDTSQQYGDVVLFRYPEERVRARREQSARRAKMQISSAGKNYLEGASAAEFQGSGGRSTRFARTEHSTYVEGDGEIVEVLRDTPNRRPNGIMGE